METIGEGVHNINKLTVIASESYRGFVDDLQSDIKKVLYERPTRANKEYFTGKEIKVDGKKTTVIDSKQAEMIEFYLIQNNYVDFERKITDKYRADLEMQTLAPMPAELAPLSEGIHHWVQAVFDESVLKEMIEDGKKTKIEANNLNENFYKKEFQALWKQINSKYAYIVSFDSEELIDKAIAKINEELFVTELTYVTTVGEQKDEMVAGELARGEAFDVATMRSKKLKKTGVSQIRYDLIGKIAAGSKLTRRSAAKILQGIDPMKFEMFQANPEEFLSKVIALIDEQKATMIVEHISYNKIDGEYDSTIFTTEKTSRSIEDAYRTKKHVQDYVFTDGISDDKSRERRFVEDMEYAEEVCVYAKLPRGFHIPTPVGNYTPDWAIAFYEGSVKHIYFIAETKGSMESFNLRPVEKAKIDCAKKLFNEISTEHVRYAYVDSYEALLNIMDSIR